MRLLILLLFAVPASAQYTYIISADSTKLRRVGGNNELILENGTRSITGLLTNYGNGRTRFMKPRISGDTLFVGVDTILLGFTPSGTAWLTAGNAGIGSGWLGTSDAVPLQFRTNNTARMTFGSAGNLDAAFAGVVNILNSSTSSTRISNSNGTDSSFLQVNRGIGSSTVRGTAIRGTSTANMILTNNGASSSFSNGTSGGSIEITGALIHLGQGLTGTADNSAIHIYVDSIQLLPPAGRLHIDTLRAATDTTLSKPMTWDPATGRWQYLSYWPSGGGSGGIGSYQDSIANVRAYGAVGDGVTNDAGAIAAAIATGRTVYFPKGTYLLGTTVITLANRGQRLFGDGEASVIKTTKTNGAAVYVTGSYVQIDNMKFKGSEDGYAATSLPTRAVFSYQMAIWIHSPNNIIRDCFFDSIGGRAIYNIDPNVAVAQHYNNFTGNKFINVRVCIENDFLGEYTQISNNDFAGNYCGYYEGVAGNNTLFGNTFQANKRAVVYDGQGNGLHGSFTANVVNHNTESALEIQQGLTGLSITGNQFFDNSIFLGTVDTVANITFSNNQFGSSASITATRVKLSSVLGGSFYGTVTLSGSGLTYNDVKNNPSNGFEVGVGGPGNIKYTGQASSAKQAVTYGATTTWNWNSGTNAEVTLTGNITTFTITNAVPGTYATIRMIQDGTGSRLLSALPSGSKVFNGGAGAITLSTAASAIDLLTVYYDGTNYYWNYALNYN